MNQEILPVRFNKNRLIKITLLKFQLEHPSEIISKLAGRIVDHFKLVKRGIYEPN
jgi:hypothetical protein